jgi:hypothetical protein
MLPILTAALLLGAPQPADNQIQIQLDVELATVPATDLPATACKIAPHDQHRKFGVLSAQERQVVDDALHASREARRAKILAERKLVALSGGLAHFLCGGQQAILNGTFTDKGIGVDYVAVGTDLEFLPIALNNGRIYLETHLRIRSVSPGKGGTMWYGFVPGFDEDSMGTSVEMNDGATFAIWHPETVVADRDAGCGQLILVTAHLIRKAEAPPATKSPKEQRLEKKAAALVEKYHAACKAGDLEKARKLARQALDLNPTCFDKLSSEAAASGFSSRTKPVIDQHEDIHVIRQEWQQIWFHYQPPHMTPERVHGGIQ